MMTSKFFKVFCLVFLLGALSLSLIGCAESKTLSEDQYQISRQGNTFTVKVSGSDTNAQNIESLEVKIRYKYTYIDYGNGSLYAEDIVVKTKTETFVAKRSGGTSGSFVGSFSVSDSVFEFDCKKVVAYYADESYTDESQQPSDGIQIGILESLGYAFFFCICCVVAWFILSLFLDVNLAFYIASAPGVIIFLGLLVTGQWIPAIIFILSDGVALTIEQVIYNKICG